MANPTCTAGSLITSCSSLLNISQKALKAEIIYMMQLELTALGGTDYTGQLAGSLLADTMTATCGLSTPQVKSAEFAVAFNNAKAAGATPPEFQDRQTAIACLVKGVPEENLDRIKLFLMCSLGVHKAFPQ